MDKDGENDICIQITCCFSSDNLNRRYDLNVNQEDTKHPVIESEFLYTEDDTVDKIFHDTIEELNLARLYLNGYDVTIVKNGKRNIFYEQHDGNITLKTEKSSTASSSSNEDTDDDNDDPNGFVHSFIRTIFEELVSLKEVHYIFSVGWTEINELNQLLDLLNGNGLAQCFSLPQLLETISIGLKNKNEMNNHNILSIVLEQQWIDNSNGQPMHKVSTVNFCDFRYANEKPSPFSNHQAVNEQIHFYPQPTSTYLPPYVLSPPPQLPHTSFFSMPLPPNMMLPTSPDAMFFNGNNFRNNFFDNANALVVQQNQRLLKNAETLLSKLTINDIDDERRKEIQDWMYLKNECDSYLSSTLELPPPSYFHNNSMLPPQQQQPSSLLPIIEMDENSTGRDEDETNEDNDSESGSYIDINDQSNNLFGKISDKIENFQQKTDELVHEKSTEYFENNPKVIFSSGSDCKLKEPQAALPYDNDNLLDEAVGGCDGNDLTKSYTTSEQYLATGRRRSIRDNNILNSDELDLIRKAAAATSFDMDSIKEGPENEHQTKLDELKKTLKKSIA